MKTLPPSLPPAARQEVLDFLLTRRSRPLKLLQGPAPDAETLTLLLSVAARCPDHGKLEPWRFIVLEKGALNRLAGAARARAGAGTGHRIDSQGRIAVRNLAVLRGRGGNCP